MFELLKVKLIRRYKRWDRRLTLSKRQQFILITLLLTIGLVLTQLAGPELRYPLVFILSLCAYLLSAFALRDDLSRVEWLTLLVLPTLFTAAVAVYYYLLPTRWLTRIPVALLYVVGMYALLLTENIYNVAAIRTIALLRAAHSVGFLLTLVTYYLLVQTVLSLKSSVLVNIVAIVIISFLLLLQTLWSMTLEATLPKSVKSISVVLTIALAEIMWVLSFWPVNPTIAALFLTTCFYGTAGMAQQYLVERLYKKTVIEFAIVIGIVFVVVLFGTHWRGNY